MKPLAIRSATTITTQITAACAGDTQNGTVDNDNVGRLGSLENIDLIYVFATDERTRTRAQPRPLLFHKATMNVATK